MLRDVGVLQLIHRLRQHACHVHRHVADADHHRHLAVQAKVDVAVIGMCVVPADKRSGRETAVQVLARNVHFPVGFRAVRVDDRVVVLLHLRHGHVAANLHVAVEVESRLAGDALIDLRGQPNLLVVRRHPAAHQAERRGQAVIHVHNDAGFGLQQGVRGIEPARSGPDNGDAQRTFRCTQFSHD